MERDNEIYQRLQSTILPPQYKKGLIIGGVLILVVSIITTIAVVISLTPEDLEKIDENENAYLNSTTDAPITTTTTIIGVCSPNPCQNNGICNKDNEKFTCNCTGTGFSGEICESNVDDCLPDSCNNHGVCSDKVNGFSCKCDTGYDGDHCENDIDDCLPDSCNNHGVCTDKLNDFSCKCDIGFKGDHCGDDINECSENPCQNSGVCKDEIGKFMCECQDGWKGDFCEIDIDDCLPDNPCRNSGKCLDNGTNSFACECPKLWEGSTCNKALTLFALKEVHMKVNPHTGGDGCGGGATTAKVMINDSVSVCHTKAIQYPTGKTVIWKSDDQLKDCAQNKFNPKESKIYYTIQPTDNAMDYCIDEVALIFDDQELTKYKKETDDKWRDGVSDTFDLTKQ